ncbi:aldehyde dehydrogenase family protein [Acidobacteria bacterium AH-259-D05]|nr:aldehyde dehydrogenase family protein [Acidobacteria bacterium AH-259-D05]
MNLRAFKNLPLTDFSHPHNHQAMSSAIAKVRSQLGRQYEIIIGSEQVRCEEQFHSLNPSRREEVVGVFQKGTPELVDRAISVAEEAFQQWSRTPARERVECMRRVSRIITQRRLELAAWMVIEGNSKIGRGCVIYSYCHLKDVVLEEEVIVDHCSVVRDSVIGKRTRIGPFAHLRENTVIGSAARIGNFVEVKKSQVGNETKAAHLSYLGDAEIGDQVNIGAGTITCNFDGIQKHTTIIEDQVFTGSNSQLVAPLTLHKGAYVAAGSTITEDVPENALAIARGKQVNKEGWIIGVSPESTRRLPESLSRKGMAAITA